jgi:hypothetical protein
MRKSYVIHVSREAMRLCVDTDPSRGVDSVSDSKEEPKDESSAFLLAACCDAH